MPRQRALPGLAALAVLLASAGPAAARPLASDDVVLIAHLARNHQAISDTTTGPSFQLLFEFDATVGVVQKVTLTISLPDGLHWGADAPDPTEGCQGTAPAVCTQQLQSNTVGTVGGGYAWDVVADRPGAYTASATMTTEQPDPNPANNTVAFQFQVTQPSGGGGSQVTATRARLTPAKPKAGSAVAATVRVIAGGSSVRPSRVACTATVAGRTLRGVGRSAAGSATCRYRPPLSAKGKVLRGTVAFTATGTRITKRFAVRLG